MSTNVKGHAALLGHAALWAVIAASWLTEAGPAGKMLRRVSEGAYAFNNGHIEFRSFGPEMNFIPRVVRRPKIVADSGRRPSASRTRSRRISPEMWIPFFVSIVRSESANRRPGSGKATEPNGQTLLHRPLIRYSNVP